MSGQLHTEKRGRVAVLTLDDTERRNALSLELVDAIVEAIAQCEADDEVGAVVVTGAEPAFCSGADVAALNALSLILVSPALVYTQVVVMLGCWSAPWARK